MIDGPDDVADMEDVTVFHVGIRRLKHLIVSAGWRAPGITGLGTETAAAKRRAYEAV